MYILTYNVNGIRAAVRKGLADWLAQENPDVVCIQETKAQPDQIPASLFEDLGYHTYWYSAERKGYSGVGILCREKPLHVEYGMGMDQYDREGRVIRADFGDKSIMSVYHPNGSASDERHHYKMGWLDDFVHYVNRLRQQQSKLVIAGDFNICHKEIDIHDPQQHVNTSGFLPEERSWVSQFLETGFSDSFRAFNQQPHQYTWWSFRANARQRNLGWRIDYNMVTDNLVPSLKDAGIMPEVKHSDHCPAWVALG